MQQPGGIARGRLQRMAEGMAEIEQCAHAGFGLVLGHDRSLGFAGAADGMNARLPVPAHDKLGAGFQPAEERCIAQQAVFRDFGITCSQFAPRQRVEQADVGDHRHRLMEGADQVLAMDGIDAGLAADGRVDLGQKRWSGSG